MTVDVTAWLTLSQTPGIGAITFHRLCAKFGCPERIVRASKAALRSAGLDEKAVNFLQNPPQQRLAATLAWAKRESHCIRTFNCPQYPKKLKELKDAPPLLYIKGNEELLHEPQLAVVGTRRPTVAGRANAKKFTQDLAQAGLLINSGLAAGIDAIAHETALGNSTTIAVVATGPEKIFPSQNKNLAEKIAERGVVVSEFPVGTPLLKTNFPRRNRIISALSLGVLVIEAGLRSGALITARMAAEQGREVFAVPGTITNPEAKGCHSLIQQGAHLIESAEDILLILKPSFEQYIRADKTPPRRGEAQSSPPSGLNEAQLKIVTAMGYEPTEIDTIVERCALPVQEVFATLVALEAEGYIAEDNGTYTRIK